MKIRTHLTFDEWNALMEQKKIEDLSDDLPDSFLLVGQVMRAKVRIEGVVYYASAWVDGRVTLVTRK